MTTHDEKQGIFDYPNFRNDLSSFSNAAGLLGLMGLVSSLVGNGIIFKVWGLNFFAIATPSDLMMSGANYVITAILVLTILYCMSYFYAKMIQRDTRGLANRLEKRVGMLISDLLPVIFILLIATIGIALNIIFDRLPSGFFKSQSPLYIYVMITLEIFIVTIWMHVVSANHKTEYLKKLKKALRMPISSLALATFLLMMQFVLLAFVAKPGWIIVPNSKYCAKDTEVVWMGSDSVVARCGPSASVVSEHDDFFILRRSEVTLKRLKADR